MGNCCFKKSIIFQDKNQDEDMWNNLPPEVWMQIFEQFSSLKDIQNCYFTCQKWQSIIKTMFKDKGKIIIGFGVSPAGGIDLNVLCEAEGARRKSVLVKYRENSKVQCKLCGDKYPYNHMEFHVVGVHGLDGPKEMYIDV